MANLQSPNLEWDCVTCRSGGFQVQGFICMNGFPIFAGEVGRTFAEVGHVEARQDWLRERLGLSSFLLKPTLNYQTLLFCRFLL